MVLQDFSLTEALSERFKILALSPVCYRYVFIIWLGVLENSIKITSHLNCYWNAFKPPSLVNIIYWSYKLQYIGNLQTNTAAFLKYFLDWQQKANHVHIQVLQVSEVKKKSLSLKESLKEMGHVLKDQPKYDNLLLLKLKRTFIIYFPLLIFPCPIGCIVSCLSLWSREENFPINAASTPWILVMPAVRWSIC